MIEIDTSPFSQLGFLQGTWTTLSLIFAFLIVIGLCIVEAKRYGKPLNPDIIYLSLLVMVGSMIGSSILAILDGPQSLGSNPLEVTFTPALTGRVWGFFIGAEVSIFIFTRLNKRWSFWETADILAPGGMLAIALYRIGCLISGCCYGKYCDLPWAVIYTNPKTLAPLVTPLHPTQLYHLLLGLIAFAIVWLFRKTIKPQGSLALLFTTLFAATDLLVRPFRAGESFLLGLQQAQVIGIITLLISIPWFIIKLRSAR